MKLLNEVKDFGQIIITHGTFLNKVFFQILIVDDMVFFYITLVYQENTNTDNIYIDQKVELAETSTITLDDTQYKKIIFDPTKLC